MSPVASVIIVTWNKRELALESVQSVLDQTIAERLEVIVVDNGSTDGTADLLEQTFADRVQVIRSPVNRGFAGGNNLGFGHAQGEYLLLLNDDAVAARGWAEALLRGAEQRTQVAMCTSKTLCYEDRTLIDNVGHLIYPDGLNRSRGHLTRDVGQYDELEETLFASGCAALYSRGAVRAVGGFDEDFFAYGDDADLGLKLRLAGYRCLYVPDAVVYHRQSASTGATSMQKLFWIERNRVWVLIKYFPLSTIVASPVYTARRLIGSIVAARAGRGLAGALARDHSLLVVGATIAHGWLASLRGLPRMVSKRRQVRRFSVLSRRQLSALLERFRASAEEMAFG